MALLSVCLVVLLSPAQAPTAEPDAWERHRQDGIAALRRGAPADAEAAFRRALAPIPPDDWRRVQGLRLVGEAVYAQRRTAEAEALYRGALELAERLAQPDSPRVLVPLTTLASFFLAERRYEDAYGAYTRALAITENAYGASDPRTAVPLVALAEIDLLRGDLAAAEARYRSVLRAPSAGRRTADDTLRELDLAWVLRARGSFGEARTLEQSARRIFAARAKDWAPTLENSLRAYRAMLGPTHPLLAVTLRQMAMLFTAQGRLTDARRMYETVFALFERGGLGDSLLMAAALETYAEVLQQSGDEAARRLALGRAAAIRDEHRRRPRDS